VFVCVGRCLRAYRLHLEFHPHRASFLKLKCSFEHLPIDEGAFQVHKHQVVAAGRKLDGGARLDLKPALDGAHARNAILNRSGMNFGPGALCDRAAKQAIRRRAGIDDGYKATGNLGSCWSCTNPGMHDPKGTGLVFMRVGQATCASKRQRDREKTLQTWGCIDPALMQARISRLS
jgi:hypothetical protein